MPEFIKNNIDTANLEIAKDGLIEFGKWVGRYQAIILIICIPIVFLYIGYRIGTKGKFMKLRLKVITLCKRAEGKTRQEFNFPAHIEILEKEINKARNLDQINELEKNYLIGTLNQLLQMPVYFRR